jgi:NAD(P)H-dependent FMN reductase
VAKRVAVIVGSTRPGRITSVITEWLLDLMPTSGSTSYDIVDLAAVNLPFLDEPLKAAFGQYEHAHTKAWSATVSAYDGFVFVFPQYNWGYPAPLKNALDFLYAEWAGKPAALVCHGTRGGGRGAQQLHQVLTGLHMATIEPYLLLSIANDDVDHAEQLIDAAATLAPFRDEARALGQALALALADAGH